MNRIRVAVGLVVAFWVTGGVGSAEEAPLRSRLEPFERLVGTVWIGAFPDGSLTDEQEFEWVYEGRFLRNRHRVKDAAGIVVYEGETIYAWDVSSETVVWWYWNATGGFVTGTLAQTEAGWSFAGANHAPAPQPEKVKGLFRFTAEDAWESVSYFQTDEGWKERFTMTFRPRDPSSD